MAAFRHIMVLVLGALMIAGLQSCEDPFGLGEEGSIPTNATNERVPTTETRHAMILYSAGFNNLSSYLRQDIEDLTTGYLPSGARFDDLVLVISRLPDKSRDYSVPVSPVIIRLYKDTEGNPVRDTVHTMAATAMLTDKTVMRQALEYIQKYYPARDYGMIVSSHASGWLPEGYYTRPKSSTGMMSAASLFLDQEDTPEKPLTKSILADIDVNSGGTLREMELADFAGALPFHLNYLMFDACLMGGVEVAYELKDVADKVGFSQTEVLADGFDYAKLASRILESPRMDVESVADDYYSIYKDKKGIMQSATYSVVKSSELDNLAAACKPLFEKYRSQISTLNYNTVQRYYGDDYHWFYDIEDILDKAGAKSDMTEFYSAMDKCITYKAHTPSFMEEFDINVFSGMSMFLPSHGSSYLKRKYKELAWNQATELVK